MVTFRLRNKSEAPEAGATGTARAPLYAGMSRSGNVYAGGARDADRRVSERLTEEAAAALAKGRFARALRAYEALAELEPAVATHRLRIADCLVKLGRGAEAVARYCEAARRYEAAGRESQALAAWHLANKLDPSDRSAENGLFAAEAILATRRFRAPLRAGDARERFEPVDVDVGEIRIQTSSEAVREELAHKQEMTGVARERVLPRAEDLESRIETLESDLRAARRISVYRALEADVARARRFRLDLSVLVLDASAGALPVVEECVRMTDIVAVLPDGRLVVVALGASARGARRVADKIRAAMAELTPPVDVTIGLAPLIDEADAPLVSGRELLAAAVAALERALDAGHHVSIASSSWLVLPAGGNAEVPSR